MALFSMVKNVISDAAEFLPGIQEKGRHVLELIHSHPWTSLGVAAGTALVWSYIKAPRNLPPGPMNLPIIGAPSCFTIDLASKMMEWRPIYGEIVSYYAFGQLHVILNSDRLIREAFVKRQEQFSHRAFDFVFAYIGLNDEIFRSPYNETWKRNKKFALATLKTYGFRTSKSEEMINEQIQQFEHFLLRSKGLPVEVSHEIRLLRTGEISSILFSGNSSWNDQDIVDLQKLTVGWNQALSDSFLIPFKEQSQFIARIIGWRTLRKYDSYQTDLMNHIKCRIEDHVIGISEREPADVVDGYVIERGTDSQMLKVIAETLLLFLPDAIDTASAEDHWNLLHLTCDPYVQKKLQEEVDSVCGPNRKPTVADREAMPYAQAVIQETLRHHLILPLSLPRVLKEKVTLDGYTLPKGTLIKANLFAASNEPDTFINPLLYDPSRFIKDDGTFDTTLANKVAAFSLGSRKCPGEPFFKATSFLLLTRLVQRFHLSFDPSGPKPSLTKDETFYFSQPQNFKICFKLR